MEPITVVAWVMLVGLLISAPVAAVVFGGEPVRDRQSQLAALTFGSRHSIAVAAVLSSQFAALAALAAYTLFGES